MKASITAGVALGLVLSAAALAGCGGATGTPATPSATLANGAGKAMPLDRHSSWMAPDAKTTDLLYVSDLGSGNVYAFSYPGGKLKGTLTGFQAQHYECVDKAGDVFVATGSTGEVLEYAHGGKAPIATLTYPNSYVNGCAIDPVNGNLAVSYGPLGSGPGGVLVYRHAAGKPKVYGTPNVFRYYFVGYDDKGNLFVDGTDYHVAFEFAELPRGGTAFKAVTLQQTIVYPGAIAWDGRHLAVGDQLDLFGPSVIYRFDVRGTTGALVGTVSLTDSCDVLQFWIFNGRAITANDCDGQVKYFSYPGGGSSLKSIGSPLSQPVGVTVSVKGT